VVDLGPVEAGRVDADLFEDPFDLEADDASVLALLKDGAITPHVAARIPLREAAKAMTLAESRTVYGKVVLVP
jgi:NADPH:quinone reductase-like Zn-dependent oxidoreductase